MAAIIREALRRVFALALVLIVGYQTGIRISNIPKNVQKTEPLPYTDGEINIFANIVDGEVGGITGVVTIVYANGTVRKADGYTLRRIHTRVVHNQVRSELFPNTVSRCAALYWSSSYTGTGRRSSERWQSCREYVISALRGFHEVPDNVFAATGDPYFSSRYPAYRLWAKVKWDTGWVSGTFYYYAYAP